MKKTISLDLRERILAAYDADEGTREAVARRFRVSLGMVKNYSNNAAASATSGPSTTALAASRALSPAMSTSCRRCWIKSPI